MTTFSHCYFYYPDRVTLNSDSRINFFITFYEQKDVPDLTMIRNINIHEIPSVKYYNMSYESYGTEKVKDFYLPNNLTGKLYARVVAIFRTYDDEITIDLLGIVEVVSYTPRVFLIIVIICISIFIMGGIIWIIYLKMNKKENLNLNINDEISMKIL